MALFSLSIGERFAIRSQGWHGSGLDCRSKKWLHHSRFVVGCWRAVGHFDFSARFPDGPVELQEFGELHGRKTFTASTNADGTE